MPGALEALIFDFDGTLAETEDMHRQTFNESFAAANLGWHWDQETYAQLLDSADRKGCIARYAAAYGLPALSHERIEALYANKTARYTKAVAAGLVALRPGVARLIEEAQQAGLKLALASCSCSRASIDALLRVTLGRQPFSVVIASDAIRRRKPDPDVYLLALLRLGLPARSCLAIEDTQAGLASASAAGFPCLITLSLYGGTGPFAGALSVVDHLGEPDLPSVHQAGLPLLSDYVSLEELRAWMACVE